MKKQLAIFIFGLGALIATNLSQAETLLEVYNQAQRNDPTFKAAEAQWLATRENSAISRSYLLPQLGAQGSVQRQHVDQSFFIDTSNDPRNTQFQLSLNQILFNYKAWEAYKTAKTQARQAQATYYAAAQDLMMRTSNAYFAVLQAYDTWQTTVAQKKSLGEQLNQTEQQYKVGLIPQTGVQQVRSSYDTAVAQEIAAKNSVSDRLEELRSLTGVFYTELCGTQKGIPLTPPIPRDINAWVTVASHQNFSVQAANFAATAAHENIKTQNAGHYPVVQATSSFAYQDITAFQLGLPGEQRAVPLTTRTSSIGLQANLPIYQGGLVTAQTRQAAYQYAQASAQREQTLRGAQMQTREAYLGVITGISKLQADRQAVVSSNASLHSTKASYTAGVSTIVDVLQQQASWFNSHTTLTTDQYNYLISTLSLKEAAGTLSGCDIAAVSLWLNHPINLSAFNFNVHESMAYAAPAPTSYPQKNKKKYHRK